MHEDAICQHRRDYTYTVPYVLANPISATRDHETGMAMSRLMATGRCRGRAAPRLCRASRPRHRQPYGFHRPAGHECDTPLATAGAARFARGIFRRTRIRKYVLRQGGKVRIFCFVCEMIGNGYGTGECPCFLFARSCFAVSQRRGARPAAGPSRVALL